MSRKFFALTLVLGLLVLAGCEMPETETTFDVTSGTEDEGTTDTTDNTDSTDTTDTEATDTEATDTEDELSYDAFAQCLTNAKAMLYGAYWCPHCNHQKEMFGGAVEYIEYNECDPNAEDSQALACIEAGIEAYPTWVIGGETKLRGVQSFEKLSEVTGCALPE